MLDDKTRDESKINPFKVSPLFLEKIWGGQALRNTLNKNTSGGAKIGESWEVSGEEPYQSKIAEGPHEGKRLGDICKMYGGKFLGSGNDNDQFPLLYKFIDANDKLSVQVHPDDFQAQEYGWGTRGKTECWYIVNAAPGATVIAGLKKSISRDEMLDAINNRTFSSMLNEEPIAPGDILFIPAGTIHAIMSNTLIYEVQESSDITMRVYDWDRLDDSGKPRMLHIKDAVNITDTQHRGSYKIKPVTLTHQNYIHSYRVACKFFSVEQYSIKNPVTITLPVKKSFCVLTMVKGCVTMLDAVNNSITISNGESVLIPAMYDNCLISGSEESEILLSYVPDLAKEVIEPLTKINVPIPDIIALGGVVGERNDVLALMRK
jgi:mannose-6-phosphate isomerase